MPDAERNLADVADDLYGLPLADFIAARTARVKEAKAEGAKELAAQIGKLPKPSTAAWAVNTLGREAPDDLDAVLDLGAALREAQESLDGEELRELTRQRQTLIRELVRRARAVTKAAGHPISDAVAEDVEQTLRAAMADEQAAEAVRSHQLTSALSASGGTLLAATALTGVPPRRAARTGAGHDGAAPDRSGQDGRAAGKGAAGKGGAGEGDKDARERAAHEDAERSARERELADARTSVAEAQEAVAVADAEVLAQQERADAAADRQEDLRTTVRDLEERLRRATAELTAVDAEVAAESRALAAVERAASVAQRELDRATQRVERLQT